MASNNAYGPQTVRDGLLLHLDANEAKSYPGASNKWYDLSGNSNTGTFQDDTQFAILNNRKTIAFDGTDDYVTTTNAINFGTSDFTFASWFIQTGSAADEVLIGLATGGHAVGLSTRYYGIGAGTGVTFSTTAAYSADADHSVEGTTVVAQNTWYYLVGTRIGSAMHIYVNGKLDTTQNGDGTINNLGSITPWIGRMRSGQHELHGNIAATSIYNRAISAAEVKQNFNAHRARFGL